MTRSLIAAIAMLGVLGTATPADAQYYYYPATTYYYPQQTYYYPQQTYYSPGVIQAGAVTYTPLTDTVGVGNVYYSSGTGMYYSPTSSNYYSNGYYSPYRTWNNNYYYGRRGWRR